MCYCYSCIRNQFAYFIFYDIDVLYTIVDKEQYLSNRKNAGNNR